MSAISTDGMDKWLDDAYPDLDRRKANMIYEIASLIKDDPDTAPVLIEELVDIMFWCIYLLGFMCCQIP